MRASPSVRGSLPRHDSRAAMRAPISDIELRMRRTAGQDGSDRLRRAIDNLVERTAASIAVPREWEHRAEDFARAYLGMEVEP